MAVEQSARHNIESPKVQISATMLLIGTAASEVVDDMEAIIVDRGIAAATACLESYIKLFVKAVELEMENRARHAFADNQFDKSDVETTAK